MNLSVEINRQRRIRTAAVLHIDRSMGRKVTGVLTMVKAIVGANWGDEGKGKITDMLATSADVVVRFQGGANAGHTIKNQYGKFALHLLPSGVFNDNVTCVIGNGVALNIDQFTKELKGILEKGVKTPKIMISDRAQIVMPYHVLFDVYEEETPNVFEDRSDEILEHSTTARLLSFPNVMITSHQGFFTKEALEAIAETTLQNALDFESGKKSPNQVQ